MHCGNVVNMTYWQDIFAIGNGNDEASYIYYKHKYNATKLPIITFPAVTNNIYDTLNDCYSYLHQKWWLQGQLLPQLLDKIYWHSEKPIRIPSYILRHPETNVIRSYLLLSRLWIWLLHYMSINKHQNWSNVVSIQTTYYTYLLLL